MNSDNSMRAAWFESCGPASESLKLGTQLKPDAGDEEVLVRIKSSGVNPSDVKKRAAGAATQLDEGFIIPHSDGAGIIEAVGAGVSTDRIGERVWVYQAQFGRRFGTAAEYLAINQSRAVTLPDMASFETGACLGIPVMTAHRCVFAEGTVEGKTLLVTGGAGRVGYYAIQWAAQAGARVFATAGNHADGKICEAAGAIAVVNHREADWAEQLLRLGGGEKIDRVIDVEFGANLPQVLKLINTSGVIVSYSSMQVPEPRLPFLQMMYLDLTLRLVLVYVMPEQAKQAAIADISVALQRESLQHRIAHRLKFDEIVRSHELVEAGGTGGCVIVNIDDTGN